MSALHAGMSLLDYFAGQACVGVAAADVAVEEKEPFSVQLRGKIREHGKILALSKQSGVPQSTLYRFYAGGTLTMRNIDKLMSVLKLGIKRA